MDKTSQQTTVTVQMLRDFADGLMSFMTDDCGVSECTLKGTKADRSRV